MTALQPGNPSGKRASNRALPVVERGYTTRLSRCGAHVQDVRLLTTRWRYGDDVDHGAPRRLLSHLGPTRAAELIQCAFVPRFVRSQPPDLWRALAVIESAEWPLQRIRPLHLYATATAEPLLADVVIGCVHPRYASGQTDLDVEDIARFIDRRPGDCFPRGRWSEASTRRIAQALLSVLRDYGLLAGLAKKRIQPISLPLPTFAMLSRARYESGVRGVHLLRDTTWQLFRLDETYVERCFIECQQRGFLDYYAAGSLIRIDYPASDLEGYARALVERAA